MTGIAEPGLDRVNDRAGGEQQGEHNGAGEQIKKTRPDGEMEELAGAELDAEVFEKLLPTSFTFRG